MFDRCWGGVWDATSASKVGRVSRLTQRNGDESMELNGRLLLWAEVIGDLNVLNTAPSPIKIISCLELESLGVIRNCSSQNKLISSSP